MDIIQRHIQQQKLNITFDDTIDFDEHWRLGESWNSLGDFSGVKSLLT